MTVSEASGCVYVVATPIGNLEDASPRMRRVLGEVALLCCEDTRHTAKLCRHFGIATPRVSLHAHNEERRIPELLERLAHGDSLALVSDAGTPLVSDPGARLVAAAIAAGFDVVPVPGPSAVLAALVTSGLDVRRFAFEGFLPRKGSARREALRRLAGFPGAVVLFEAANRANETLADLCAALGPRRAAVAREVTKRHEEVVRGRLGEIALERTLGEVTIVVEGPARGEEAPPDDAGDAAIDLRIDELLGSGESPRDAARRLAAETSLSRSDAYARVQARRARGTPG